MTDNPIVGIDVSKGWLDLCSSYGAPAVVRIDNDPAAIGAWLDWAHPRLVACEPSGG
jgi:hypothetical protein